MESESESSPDGSPERSSQAQIENFLKKAAAFDKEIFKQHSSQRPIFIEGALTLDRTSSVEIVKSGTISSSFESTRTMFSPSTSPPVASQLPITFTECKDRSPGPCTINSFQLGRIQKSFRPRWQTTENETPQNDTGSLRKEHMFCVSPDWRFQTARSKSISGFEEEEGKKLKESYERAPHIKASPSGKQILARGRLSPSPLIKSFNESSAFDILNADAISLSGNENSRSQIQRKGETTKTKTVSTSAVLKHKTRFGCNKQQPPNMYQDGHLDPKYQYHQLKKKFFSPFFGEDEEDLLRQRTHNRRRWSHVFPVGEVEFKRVTGPNYKSLCMPACLPLTVDYFPTDQDLQNNYLEGQYMLTLVASDANFYRNEEDLMKELVIQRLNQDFQLVVQNSEKNLEKKSARKSSLSSSEYILSMGHRIHILKKIGNNQIEVKHYLARFGNNTDPGNRIDYDYLLWNNQSNQWQKVSRIFSRYVEEYNWNHSDQIVQGNLTEFTDAIKFRRIDFVVIPSPDTATQKEAEEKYITKLLEFIDYLNTRAHGSTQMSDLQVLKRLTRPEGEPEPGTSSEKWIPKHDIKVCFKVHKDSEQTGRWLFVNCDKILDPIKCYHIAIHWLVCSGANVFDFVTSILRRSNQLELKLTQIQHNIRTRTLNLHAYQVGTHIELKDPVLKKLAETALVENFGFVRDSGQETDWSKYGWGSEEAESRNQNVLAASFQPSTIRAKHYQKERIFHHQFIHNTGLFYIRVAPQGFIWMANYLLKANNCSYQVSEALREIRNFDAASSGGSDSSLLTLVEKKGLAVDDKSAFSDTLLKQFTNYVMLLKLSSFAP